MKRNNENINAFLRAYECAEGGSADGVSRYMLWCDENRDFLLFAIQDMQRMDWMSREGLQIKHRDDTITVATGYFSDRVEGLGYGLRQAVDVAILNAKQKARKNEA